MNRRLALNRLALAMGGLLALPAWATAWSPATLPAGHALLNGTEADTLAQMTDTLIPASDTPGAVALGVPAFVQRMVADCYEPAMQQTVKDGLTTLDVLANERFAQPFAACNISQRTEVLTAMEQSPEAARKEFYKSVKNLTIQGYTTSEYVMTRFLNYTMVPGHFYGCVPAPVATR